MKKGDLARLMIGGDIVILIEQVARKVWSVVRTDGTITSEWELNIVPFNEGN